MFAQERQQKILELLKERVRLSVPELEDFFGASPATVRRDLSFLEEAGKLLRTHGGAMSRDDGHGEASFDRKYRQELRAKSAIADAASGLVGEGFAVFVDSGTTAFGAGIRLLPRADLTIFTNSIPLLQHSADARARRVALGGEVRAVSLALVGAEALGWLDRIRFDMAFIGASGIDAVAGPCTTELAEAAVKTAAIRNSRRAVVLADASKWRETAPIRFADWADVHDIVTDYRPTPPEQAILDRRRVSLHQVRK